MDIDRMEEQLVLHEGVELEPYVDTEGYWTIGVGYNLSSRGLDLLEQTIGRKIKLDRPRIECPFHGLMLTRKEALKMLRIDIVRVEKSINLRLPRYKELGDVRQRVILDMGFNMGRRALNFRMALKHMRHEVAGRWRPNWSGVGRELYNSKWAYQVGDGPGKRMDRAERLVNMVLTGEDYIV